MSDYIVDVSRRLKNTNLTEAMFEVSMDNTIKKKKRLDTNYMTSVSHYM